MTKHFNMTKLISNIKFVRIITYIDSEHRTLNNDKENNKLDIDYMIFVLT